MKTTDFIKGFKNLKREQKEFGQRLAYTNMIGQSIDFLPEGWRISRVYSCWSIEIRPSLDSEGKERSVMANEFDKIVNKISGMYRKEPCVNIDSDSMKANWNLSAKFYDKIAGWCDVELKCGNTEKCEIIEKEVPRIEYELTGYCKILKEKKYLQTIKS